MSYMLDMTPTSLVARFPFADNLKRAEFSAGFMQSEKLENIQLLWRKIARLKSSANGKRACSGCSASYRQNHYSASVNLIQNGILQFAFTLSESSGIVLQS